eukprot:164667_1
MNNMYWNTTQNAISGAGHSTYSTLEECENKFIETNYRSFIYFNSNYSIISFRNYCYVRSDTWWNPTAQNNVISGRIDNFSNCRNNFECELNGKCIDNKCQCKPYFTGDFCQYMNVKKGSKNYGYQWGGSVIFDYNSNTFNVFASEMIDQCGITTCCCCNSQIVLATSKNASGPYKYKSVIKPYFAHEPNIVYHQKDNIYLLYHWGDANSSQVNPKNDSCLEGYTHGPPTEFEQEIFNDKLHQNRITMNYISYSTDINDINQWKNNMILMQGDDIDFDLCPSNPYFFANGSVLQFWIERIPGTNQSFNGSVYTPTSYIHLMTAISWNTSYTFSWKPLWTTSLMDQSSMEDPFLWRDEQDGTFHLLMHGCTPINYTGIVDNMDPTSAGRHAYSLDGLNWTLSPHYTYNTTICYDDGDCIEYGRRERPHLIFDINTNQPIYLTTSIQIYPE